MDRPEAEQNGLRLLFVEDDPADAELCVAALRKAGCIATTARVETVEQFRNYLNSTPCDVILADYNLAGWNGLDALKELQKTGLDIPFILISGRLGDEIAAECIKRGAADYVLKDRLIRLPLAIQRAMSERALRQERAAAAAALRQSELRYRGLFERNLAGVLRATLDDGRILDCNDSLARILGYESRAELLGISALNLYLGPEQREAVHERLQREGVVTNCELCLRRRDGAPAWVLANANVVVDAETGASLVDSTLIDVTERKEAERKVLRLNRLYCVISGINQAIVRIEDRDRLLSEVCRIIVEQGLFRMVWFGVLDERKRQIVPAAHAGAGDGALESYEIRAGDSGDEGVTSSALRREPHFVCNDVVLEPCSRPWCTEALRLGFRSSAAFPIKVRGRIFGVLHLFASEPGFFDAENIALLGEVVADVAFALESMEREAQRKRAEEERAQALVREETARALAKSEARFRELLEAAPDPILQIDGEDRIAVLNTAAERVFGYSREELLGMPCSRLIPERSRDAYARLRAQCLDSASPSAVGPEEVSARRKNGKELILEMKFSRRETEEGRLITCIMRDVTERKHLEEQLRQSQKMEAIGRLAGGVAHDFNNLLTIIGGYSQMMLDGMEPRNPLRRDLEAVMEAANRASGLTRQLLAFSRRQIVQPKILDLNRLLGKMHKMLRRVIGEDIQLRLLPKRDLARVKADPGQLEQVVMNMAVNARDAMPRGGSLLIETANVELAQQPDDPDAALPDNVVVLPDSELAPGRYVLLTITDSGSGMDQEVKSHLFEPFFTTKGRGKGTGLGLSTVYGIIKQSGGDIAVESEPGKGSTFRIYLPAFEPVEKTFETASAAPGCTAGTETILLVEDEAELRALAREMLAKQGYRVLDAGGGSDAMRLWDQHSGEIDLLLTDVVMPHMSGHDLAEHLRALRPGLKVLYMSGYTNDVIARHGVLDAEIAFLQKPFTSDSLGHKIRRLLDSGN